MKRELVLNLIRKELVNQLKLVKEVLNSLLDVCVLYEQTNNIKTEPLDLVCEAMKTPMSSAGVGFDNSVEAPVTSGGKELSGQMATHAVDEEELTFADFARREQFIAATTWNHGMAVGVSVMEFEVPLDLLISPTLRVAFERFVYFTGDCHIRVMLQSNSFQAGQLIASYNPLTKENENLDSTLKDFSIRPNIILKAGSTSSKTLVIPFTSIYQALTSDSEVPMCTFSVHVMNVLRSGATASEDTAEISLFASFPDAKFRVINPVVDTVPVPTLASSGLVSNSAKGRMSARASKHNEQTLYKGLSMEGGVASKVTNINIDHVVNGTVDMHGLTDELDSKQDGEIAGLDRPNIGLSYTPARLMKYPDLANGRNLDYCNVLDLSAGEVCQLGVNELASSVDEMDLKYLVTKFTYDRQFKMGTVEPPGTIVASGVMTPCPLMLESASNTDIQPSLMEYCTLPFSLWRGSLKLRFEFITSKVHVMRVAFLTHYGSASVSAEIVEAFSQYAQIFDISAEQNTFDVEVPWRSPTPWLRVPHGEQTYESVSMGQWSLRIVNPLVTMDSVSNTVDCNVYIAAGDDFELRYPDMCISDYTSFITPPSMDLVMESGDLPADVGVDVVDEDIPVVEVAPSGGKSSLAPVGWRDMRAMCKRSALVTSAASEVSNVADVVDLFAGYTKWFAPLYRVWKGPLRVRVFANHQMAVGYSPSPFKSGVNVTDITSAWTSDDGTRGGGAIMLTDETVGVIDVQLPFIVPYNYCLNPRAGKVLTNKDVYNSGKLWLDYKAKGSPGPEDLLFSAVGDGFRFGLLVGIPTVRARATNSLYNHLGGTPFAVPTQFRYTIAAEHVQIMQDDLINNIIGGVADDHFILSTLKWTREDYKRLAGIDIPAGSIPDRSLPEASLFGYVQNPVWGLYRTTITAGSPGAAAAYGFTPEYVGPPESREQYDGKIYLASYEFDIAVSRERNNLVNFGRISGIPIAKTDTYIPLPGNYYVTANYQSVTPIGPSGTPNIGIWDTKGLAAFQDVA